MATKDDFHIGRIAQEHQQFRANPHFAYRWIVHEAFLCHRTENICNEKKKKEKKTNYNFKLNMLILVQGVMKSVIYSVEHFLSD